MSYTIVEKPIKFLEAAANEPWITTASDIDRVVEACFSQAVHAVLLYSSNMPATFFDLSSGDAGFILQKLRTYRIRLALVAPLGSVVMSSRFGEMLADERRGQHFGVFDTRDEAVKWIQSHDDR